VADAVALLKHLRVDRAHIVGHSGGGDIALRLALDAPDLVHSLVLLEPNDIGPLPSKMEFYNKVIAPATERYRAGDPEGAVDLFMQEMVAGPEWRAEIARTVPGGPDQAVQDAATFFEDRDSGEGWVFDEEEANRISRRLPILYVLGSETPSFLKECKDLFHTWVPHAEDHVVDGVGHSLQMEAPQAVAEGIADFLQRHPLDEHSNQ
jgi:pimeloyl-ACP methyl ester carboxylesterase